MIISSLNIENETTFYYKSDVIEMFLSYIQFVAKTENITIKFRGVMC